MRYFSCDCTAGDGKPVALFFENTQCLSCQRQVGWCFEERDMLVFDRTKDGGFHYKGRDYVPCANRANGVCNAMIPADSISAEPALCFACHFNDNIPDLTIEGHSELWGNLERAKRRLLFTLDALKLPMPDRRQSREGLSFHFMADRDASDHFRTPLTHVAAVFTGHAQGDITINLAEADDVARHRIRVDMGEQYRTLLGHFRHEVGHFYWDLLVKRDEARLARFREVFGDPNLSYQAALDKHYARDPDDQSWRSQFISAYASMHPWEDWAETFAHYLHIIDTLETARGWDLIDFGKYAGLTLPQDEGTSDPQRLIDCWGEFSVKLNALNRSMGLADAYPFVINSVVVGKLKCVHSMLDEARLPG